MTRHHRLASLVAGATCLLTVSSLAGDGPRTIGPFGAEVRVAYSPDGKSLAVTTRGGSAALVDLSNGQRTVRFEGSELESESGIAFSPDGSRFALATQEGRVRIYDARTGKVQAVINHGGELHTLAFTADGKALITGGGLPERAVSDEPGEEPAPEGEGEGEEGAVGGPTTEVDPEGATASVWNTTSGEKLLDLDAKSHNKFSGVAASPAAQIVAQARADGKLVLFDLEGKKKREIELGAPSHVVAFSPDGGLVAALGAKDGAVTLVNVASGEVVKTLGKQAGASPDGSLAFSPDGKLLAWTCRGSDGVELYTVESGKELRVLAQGAAARWSLAFAPDGKTLACGLRSGQVVLHSLE